VKHSIRSRLWGGSAIIAAAAVGAALLVNVPSAQTEGGSPTKKAAVQAVPVSVAVVEPKQTVAWDEFSGRLEAVERVDVRSRVAGAVQSVHFREGALVKQGDLLVTIDPDPYRAEVDRLQAQVVAAEARLAFTKGEVERGQPLLDSRVVSPRDFDQRTNAYREADANLRAAKAALQASQLNLGYTEVRAPVDGWVTNLDLRPGAYATADGWIRLHTNAPHHRAAALAVLGVPEEKAAVERAVAQWNAEALESEIVKAKGCAAAMRSMAEWARHPQGESVLREPLFAAQATNDATDATWPWATDRPLRGLCVLDLTRVLAGPVATRFLAGFGANVLRIDPPTWDEPGVVPDVTLGKRCARLDLRDSTQREIFVELLRRADVLVHGYRADALETLGTVPGIGIVRFDARDVVRHRLVTAIVQAYDARDAQRRKPLPPDPGR